ncbi:cell division protein FtsL, partial [Brevundimonas denitrificans]
MRWNLTVFFLALFACVSYGLYQLSYEVQQLEDDLAGLRRGIENNHEAVKVLEAEWAYQNRPDVLQALAARHLPLLLIAPYQVAALDDIP